jgi:hypothetical protein
VEKDTVVEWFTGRDTFFLLGAGCSRCAGKPLIPELTTKVVEQVGEPAKGLFARLKTPSGRDPNIEDLLNHIIRRRDLIRSLNEAEKLGDLSAEDLDGVLGKIRLAIVEVVGKEWAASPFHARFLERVRHREPRTVRDVFTLNYDTLIEATLDDLQYPYSDGFRGSGAAWFDASTFEEVVAEESRFGLHKLHGSVTWRREADGFVRRYIGVSTDNEAVLVYPTEQKYVETRFGVYETLLGRFRERLRAARPNNTLVVLGYSFNDEHINEAIFDAICYRGSNLTLFAFVGPNEGASASADQIAQFNAVSSRCGARFNIFIGDNFASTSALEDHEARKVLELGLWRFEAVVDFIAGAAA